MFSQKALRSILINVRSPLCPNIEPCQREAMSIPHLWNYIYILSRNPPCSILYQNIHLREAHLLVKSFLPTTKMLMNKTITWAGATLGRKRPLKLIKISNKGQQTSWIQIFMPVTDHLFVIMSLINHKMFHKKMKYLGHHLLVKMSLKNHKMFDEKRNEIPGTPLVSENVPNKPQNVPWKKNKVPGTPLVSENVPKKPQNVPWKKKQSTWDTTC